MGQHGMEMTRLGLTELLRDRDLQGLQDILGEVITILNADTETDEGVRDAKGSTILGTDTAVGHEGRKFGEGLDTTQTLGESEELDGLEELDRLGQRATDTEGDHATKAGLLTGGQGMLRMRGEARVDNLGNKGGEGLEEGSDLGSVLGVALHAEVESLKATAGEEAVKGRGDSADGVL